ncbi:porin family protein [Chitinophagaceae bacterium LWZ2-11]
MKYAKTFLLLLFIFCRHNVQAQLIQITAGIPLTQNVGGNEIETITGRAIMGYKVGATVDWPIGQSMGIQTGILWLQSGSRFPKALINSGTAASDNKMRILRLQYLQLPVLWTYNLSLSRVVRWQLGAGPYIAYRINEPSQVFTLEQQNNHITGVLQDRRGESIYKRIDGGIVLNSGFQIDNRINLSMQCDFGLINVIKPAYDYQLYNQAFSLSVGYYINTNRFMRKYFSF